MFSLGEFVGGTIGGFTAGAALLSIAWYGKTHGWWCNTAGESTNLHEEYNSLNQ
jgi:hypothetical protein